MKKSFIGKSISFASLTTTSSLPSEFYLTGPVAFSLLWPILVYMRTVPVALFSERAMAEPLQQRLSQAGIAAEIHDIHWQHRLWFIPKKSAGTYYLEVPRDQFERAELLLRAWHATENALHAAIRCPECKSLRIDYPQVAHHSLLTNVAMGLTAEVGLVERDYYCQHCHYTWPKEGSETRRVRQHMAPHYFIEGIDETARQPQRGKRM
jgi:hypothetical protein